MKNALRACLAISAVCTLSLMSSCTKNSNSNPNPTPPQISFIKDPGFTSTDGTVNRNTGVLFGIVASKTQGNDLMQGIRVYVQYDSKPDTQFYYIPLYGATGDSYTNSSLYFVTRNQSGTETYKFEVDSYGGLKNTISVKLNVR